MDMDRFKQLIAAYGASFERWPQEERYAAREFSASNEEGNALLGEADALDEMLDAYHVESADAITQKVLARLPERTRRSLLDRFIDWLLPDLGHPGLRFRRPAILAGLALTVGIILGGTLPLDSTDNASVWQEELYVMALNTESIR